MSDYNAPSVPHTTRTEPVGTSHLSRPTEINAAVASTPVDRARWGAILAGLFAAISTLFLLVILGAAIGLSSYDAGDSGRAFAIGGGVWAAVSALIAFFVGGLVAGRSAALPGRGVGLFNGAMVWAVAVPATLWLATSLAGSVLNTAGAVAGTATNAAAQVAGGAASAAPEAAQAAKTAADNNPQAADEATRQAKQAGDQVQAQAQNLKQKAQNLSAQDVREGAAKAADESKSSVWWTLVSLVVALAAAAVGGAVGARDEDADARHARA